MHPAPSGCNPAADLTRRLAYHTKLAVAQDEPRTIHAGDRSNREHCSRRDCIRGWKTASSECPVTAMCMASVVVILHRGLDKDRKDPPVESRAGAARTTNMAC
jgi:hypothetical protein